jgi:hypothetical protein
MGFDLTKLTYQIMAARFPLGENESTDRNVIYSAWYKLWSDVYNSSGSDYTLNADEFLRQDLVTCIKYNQQVAAIHLYSLFDLRCSADLESHYFQFFSPHYIETLKKRNVETAMSMEFLTVMPEFRKSITGVSLASTIIQLGTHVFTQLAADAIIAPARRDVKVHEAAYDLGFECIEEDTLQRGFRCDLIACFQGRQRASRLTEVNNLATRLWQKANIFPSAHPLLMGARESRKIAA